MEQLTIDLADKKDSDRIREALLQKIHIPEFERFLDVAVNKDQTISIKAKSILVAKVKLTHNKRYIEVRSKNTENFESHLLANNMLESHPIENIGEWSRIEIKSVDDVLSLALPLSIVYMLILSELGGESFGCCSRYVECSDAKMCVNPDVMMSFACAYKRNLENGRIFYGKNKTI